MFHFRDTVTQWGGGFELPQQHPYYIRWPESASTKGRKRAGHSPAHLEEVMAKLAADNREGIPPRLLKDGFVTRLVNFNHTDLVEIDVLYSWVVMFVRYANCQNSWEYLAGILKDIDLAVRFKASGFLFAVFYLYDINNKCVDQSVLPGQKTPSEILSELFVALDVSALDVGEATTAVVQLIMDNAKVTPDIKIVALYHFFVLSCTPYLLERFFVPFWYRNMKQLLPFIAFSLHNQFDMRDMKSTPTVNGNFGFSTQGYNAKCDYLFTVLCENGLVPVHAMLGALHDVEKTLGGLQDSVRNQYQDDKVVISKYYNTYANYRFFKNKYIRELITCQHTTGYTTGRAFPNLEQLITYLDTFDNTDHPLIEKVSRSIETSFTEYGYIVDKICSQDANGLPGTADRYAALGGIVFKNPRSRVTVFQTALLDGKSKIVALLYNIFLLTSLTPVLIYLNETYRTTFATLVDTYFRVCATTNFDQFKEWFGSCKIYTWYIIPKLSKLLDHFRTNN